MSHGSNQHPVQRLKTVCPTSAPAELTIMTSFIVQVSKCWCGSFSLMQRLQAELSQQYQCRDSGPNPTHHMGGLKDQTPNVVGYRDYGLEWTHHWICDIVREAKRRRKEACLKANSWPVSVTPLKNFSGRYYTPRFQDNDTRKLAVWLGAEEK